MRLFLLAAVTSALAAGPTWADPITYALVKAEAQKAGFTLNSEKPDQNRMNMKTTIGGVQSVFDIFLSGCGEPSGCSEIGFSGDRIAPAAKAAEAATLVAEFKALGAAYTAQTATAGGSVKIVGDYRYRRPSRGLDAANATMAAQFAIKNWQKGLSVLTKPL